MSSMDWGTIWPIDNFKGHKVKKKMALAGLGAPSETTFEPIEINMSNFGNQCILANPILTWKEKKFGPKNLAKFGQTWTNFGSKIFQPQKVKQNVTHAWKIMPRNFLVDCWLFGKISVSRILPKSGKKSKKIPGMIFHALVTFCLTFWGWKVFDPKFGQVWPNLAKFFGPNFFPFHVKMGKVHWFP